ETHFQLLFIDIFVHTPAILPQGVGQKRSNDQKSLKLCEGPAELAPACGVYAACRRYRSHSKARSHVLGGKVAKVVLFWAYVPRRQQAGRPSSVAALRRVDTEYAGATSVAPSLPLRPFPPLPPNTVVY